MFNILKKNTIELIFYTDSEDIVELFPISKSTNFFPDWFKDLPKYGNHPFYLADSPNMKGCFGFIELYKQSFLMPLWSDLYYNFNFKESKLFFKYDNENIKQKTTMLSHGFCKENGVESHPKNQFKGMIEDDWEHIKIFSPWVFESSEDLNILTIDCFYHRKKMHDSFFVAPGMFNSNASNQTNINCFFNSKKENFIIPHNTPLLQMIPLTSKKIELKIKFDPLKTQNLLNHVNSSSKFWGIKRRLLKQIKK